MARRPSASFRFRMPSCVQATAGIPIQWRRAHKRGSASLLDETSATAPQRNAKRCLPKHSVLILRPKEPPIKQNKARQSKPETPETTRGSPRRTREATSARQGGGASPATQRRRALEPRPPGQQRAHRQPRRQQHQHPHTLPGGRGQHDHNDEVNYGFQNDNVLIVINMIMF